MNALILGGQSPRHKEWVRQVAAAMKADFGQIRLLDYRHWDEPDAEFAFEYELNRAADLADGLGDYVVVAKSIGTAITTIANAHGQLSPQRCVFLGFPLNVVTGQLPEVAETLNRLPPTVFVHNEHDPLGSSKDVFEFVRTHAPADYRCLALPGDTHDYEDFSLITQLAHG